MKWLPHPLNALEIKTFRLHLLYSIIEGVLLGVLALNEFVFIKSMQGSAMMLGFLLQFSVLVFVFLLFCNEFLRRVQRHKKLLRRTAWICRLPLLLLILFPQHFVPVSGMLGYHFLFLFIFFMYYLSSPVIYPVINLFLKQNYEHAHFSRLYSIATTANKVVMLVVTFFYGYLLDDDPYSYVWVFPIIGILGILSIWILSLIPYTPPSRVRPEESVFVSVKKSMKRLRNILSQHAAFRHFEIGFGFYGFAFLSTVSVMYLFFNKGLDMNYSSVAFYRNSYNILAIVLLPWLGRHMGKTDPRKFGILTFASILGYLLFLALCGWYKGYTDVGPIHIYLFLIPYVLCHGLFAAAMPLLWNIGSAYFCRQEDVGDYQALHLFLTGVRGVFAPLIGILFYEAFGFIATFLIGVVLVLLGMITLFRSYRRVPLILEE